MDFVFGQAFTFPFTPLINDRPAEAHSIVTARLYSSPPSEAQKTDHTYASGDAVESVSSWSGGPEPLQKHISFSAITDSDPTSGTDYENYYIVVSYKLESGGDNVFSDFHILVYRPRGQTSRMTVTAKDLKDMDERIGFRLTDKQIEEIIDDAYKFVILSFKAKGFERHRIKEDDLNARVKAKSAEYIGVKLFDEPGDHWDQFREVRGVEEYKNVVAAHQVGYDLDDSRGVEPTEKILGGSTFLIR